MRFTHNGKEYQVTSDSRVLEMRSGQWLPVNPAMYGDPEFAKALQTATAGSPIRGVGTKADGTLAWHDASGRELVPDGKGGFTPSGSPVTPLAPAPNTLTAPAAAPPAGTPPSQAAPTGTPGSAAGAYDPNLQFTAKNKSGNDVTYRADPSTGSVSYLDTSKGTWQPAGPDDSAAVAQAPSVISNANARKQQAPITAAYANPENDVSIQQAQLYATQAKQARAQVDEINMKLSGQLDPATRSQLREQLAQLLVTERTSLQNYGIASAQVRQKGLTLPTETALTAAEANRQNVMNSVDIYNANNDAMLKYLQSKVAARQMDDASAMQQYTQWIQTSKLGLDTQLREIDQTESAREHNINFGVAMAQQMVQQQAELLRNSAPISQVQGLETNLNQMVSDAGRPLGAPATFKADLGAPTAPPQMDIAAMVNAAMQTLPASSAAKDAVSIPTAPAWTPGAPLEQQMPAAPGTVTPPANTVSGVSAADAAAASTLPTEQGVVPGNAAIQAQQGTNPTPPNSANTPTSSDSLTNPLGAGNGP